MTKHHVLFTPLQLLLALIFSMSAPITDAKDLLPRSAFLGLVPESTNADQAVIVRALHPAGTATELGLKVGDKVDSINQQPIENFSSLIAVLRKVRAGQSLAVYITRGDQQLTLSAKAKDRPREQGEGYSVKYDAFSWQDNTIRTITYHPDKPRDDKAAVFFVQGYTCDSIDYGMLPDVSLTQLLASFAKAGYTVMKMEKPGVGDSEGKLDCYQIDFNTENQAFIAGLSHFKKLPNVASDNVFVFGHSLGVLHAALLAEKGVVKGAIGYGGVLKSWYEYLQDIYAEQSVKYWGTSAKQAKENLAVVKPFLRQWLTTTDTWSAITENKNNKAAFNADLLPINGEQVFHRHYTFFRNLNQVDFEQAWHNGQAHTLMLHGNYDIQAIDGDWANQIAAITNQQTAFTGKAEFFEQTDHALMQYPNKAELMKATRREPDNQGQFNADIATTSLKWMDAILANTSNRASVELKKH